MLFWKMREGGDLMNDEKVDLQMLQYFMNGYMAFVWAGTAFLAVPLHNFVFPERNGRGFDEISGFYTREVSQQRTLWLSA